MQLMGVERLEAFGALTGTRGYQTPNTISQDVGVRPRVTTSAVKRETTRTAS